MPLTFEALKGQRSAGQLFRKLTVFLVATVPVLVLLGLVRAIVLLRRSTGASRRAVLPAWLHQRRDTEYRRERHSFAADIAAGGMIAVGF
jgi:hypothetical protein